MNFKNCDDPTLSIITCLEITFDRHNNKHKILGLLITTMLLQLTLNMVGNSFDYINPGHKDFVHFTQPPKLTYLRIYNLLYFINESRFSNE